MADYKDTVSNQIDIINRKYPKHKLTQSQVVLHTRAGHNITIDQLLIQGFFGVAFILFGLPALISSRISIEDIGVLLPVSFLVLGTVILVISMRNFFLKPYFLLANKHLYKICVTRVVSYNWSKFIKDINVHNRSLRLKYREASRYRFNNVRIVGIKDANEVALLIWKRLNNINIAKEIRVSKSISDLSEYLSNKEGKLFEVISERVYPWTYSIMPIIIGLVWSLASTLFIYGGILGLLDSEKPFSSRSSMLIVGCIGLLFFSMGVFLLFKLGLKSLFEKGWKYLGTKDGLYLFKHNRFRIISWKEVIGTSWVKRYPKYYYLRINASLEWRGPRSRSFGPDYLFIFSKQDLKEVREAIHQRILLNKKVKL